MLAVLALYGNATAQNPRHVVTTVDITSFETVAQNWTDEEANSFYNMAQGSRLLPYTWFLHLEREDSQEPFRSHNHFLELGYLPREPANGNSDGLPIGFVRSGSHLGLTCAACHTNQINFHGKAWIIDGAPTLGNLEMLHRRLLSALEATLTEQSKFARFANAVLGSGATEAERSVLKGELAQTTEFRRRYNARNLPDGNAPPFGPGRLDAFGAIMNEVTSTFMSLPNNYHAADAPVSYPFLWDTPHHDKVQWNGAAENSISPFTSIVVGTAHVGALGRNVGQAMGVYATVDVLDTNRRYGYTSSILKQNLIGIEEKLRKLWSPQWPLELGALDTAACEKGRELFRVNCAGCHDDKFQRTSPSRQIVAKMGAVGTDPLMAANFANHRAKTGPLEGRVISLPGFRQFGKEAAVREMLLHLVQRAILGSTSIDEAPQLFADAGPGYVINAEVNLATDTNLSGVFTTFVADGFNNVRELRSREALVVKSAGKILVQDIHSFDNSAQFRSSDGVARFDLAARVSTHVENSRAETKVTFDKAEPIRYQYKARPLNGIWATAPYLHNGSVPNLDELLKPQAKRIKKFKTGSRVFDPVNVGFVTVEGPFEFDTMLRGNSNAGHEYAREFTAEERRQLIEYMKSL